MLDEGQPKYIMMTEPTRCNQMFAGSQEIHRTSPLILHDQLSVWTGHCKSYTNIVKKQEMSKAFQSVLKFR